MNDTPLTRETLLAGIENLSLRISSFTVLRRVWKILDREFEQERESYTDNPVDAQQERMALHYYARHLDRGDLQAVIRYIHQLRGV